MIKIVEGNIVKITDCEAIVNAANGVGPMGAGVARAIAQAAGQKVKNEVLKICKEDGPFEAGQSYRSSAGDLQAIGIKYIYHAVTMKFPGGLTSYYDVENALTDVLEKAISDNIKSIAVPGLGTGIGGLDLERVAELMVRRCENYSNIINIYLVDMNETFIQMLKKFLSQETNQHTPKI
jgi:O-acetyl-ADP-ribose deacetylase